MHFVQAGLLAGLAALLIPILIHLLFRLRTRQVDLGTIRFLKTVMEESSQRRRVMRWLLLALRLGCVALLALLFARPFFPAEAASSVRGLAMFLIDHSATMEQRSDGTRHFDSALSEAERIAKSLPPGTRIEVATFDSEVRPVGEKLGGKSTDSKSADKSSSLAANEVFASLRDNNRSSRGTDYAAMIAWARDTANRIDAREKQVYIFTDLQQSGLNRSDGQTLPADVVAHVNLVGKDVAENIALTQINVPRTWVRPGATPKISAVISHSGSTVLEEVPITLLLESDGRKIQQRKKIRLEPETPEQIEFDVTGLDAGLWQGKVSVEWDDALAFDNQRFLAIQAAPAMKVLLVDGAAAKQKWNATTYFLETALRLAPEGQDYAESAFAPEVVSYEDGTWHTRLNQYAAVVLADVPAISEQQWAACQKFVELGGGCVVFGGERTTAKGWEVASAQPDSPVVVGDAQFATEFPWRIQQFDEKNPLWAPLADPQFADVGRLAFGIRSVFTAKPNASVLAKFRGGDTAMVDQTLGKGHLLWCAWPVDARGSFWPKGRLFVPMTHQMLGYVTGLTDGGPVRQRLLDGLPLLPVDTQPGVVSHDRYVEVINPSPIESELDRCTVDDLVVRFGLRLADANAGTVAVDENKPLAASQMRQDEYWHWILFVLMGAFALEFLVANRSIA
jgi:hypothetical protein